MRTENAPYLRDSPSLCREKHYARPTPEIIIASSQPAIQLLLFGPVEIADIKGHDLPELSLFLCLHSESLGRELGPPGHYIIDNSDEPEMNHVARSSYSPFMCVAVGQAGGAPFSSNVMFARLQWQRPGRPLGHSRPGGCRKRPWGDRIARHAWKKQDLRLVRHVCFVAVYLTPLLPSPPAERGWG